MKTYILVYFILNIPKIYSWETDNFSTRVPLMRIDQKKAKKQLFSINDQINLRIQKGIDKYNSKINNCINDEQSDEPKILKYVYGSLGSGGLLTSSLESWINSDESDIFIPAPKFDIYDATFFNPDPSFKAGKVIMGADKLGHFFVTGYKLYQEYISTGSALKALKYSNDTEEAGGPWGLSVSGVKSYGDMAANYYGYRFYMNLIYGINPHIKCDETTDRYYLIKPFNLADYSDHSFDEGINCSTFFSMKGPINLNYLKNYSEKKANGSDNSKGKALAKSIKKIYREEYGLEENSDLKLGDHCPVERSKCKKLTTLKCASYFISPECYLSSNHSNNFSCNDSILENEIRTRPVKKHQYQDYDYQNTKNTQRQKYEIQTTKW